jgi:hypothetical protein
MGSRARSNNSRTTERRGSLREATKVAAAPCALLLVLLMFPVAIRTQVIPFESGGLKYKALTRGGMTIMFAQLPTRVRDFSILQVSISNGSPVSWQVKPEDFRFERDAGTPIQALPADTVVGTLLRKASRNDVSKLISAYEMALNGNVQMHSTNGYEARRQSAMGEGGAARMRAAAAASALALVPTKLEPGQSTDGAVFYPSTGKPLGAGRLIVNEAGEEFVFPVEAEAHGAHP